MVWCRQVGFVIVLQQMGVYGQVELVDEQVIVGIGLGQCWGQCGGQMGQYWIIVVGDGGQFFGFVFVQIFVDCGEL